MALFALITFIGIALMRLPLVVFLLGAAPLSVAARSGGRSERKALAQLAMDFSVLSLIRRRDHVLPRCIAAS